MSGEQATKLGLRPSRARDYFRLVYGKMNHARPPDDDDRWYSQRSINFGNGTRDYPHGDDVGVVEIWTRGGDGATWSVSAGEESIVLKVIAAAQADRLLTKSSKSPRCCVKPALAALRKGGYSIHRKDEEATVTLIIEGLEMAGLIREEEFRDAGRNRAKGLKITEEGRRRLDGDAPRREMAPGVILDPAMGAALTAGCWPGGVATSPSSDGWAKGGVGGGDTRKRPEGVNDSKDAAQAKNAGVDQVIFNV
jgi:hypothetical protein